MSSYQFENRHTSNEHIHWGSIYRLSCTSHLREHLHILAALLNMQYSSFINTVAKKEKLDAVLFTRHYCQCIVIPPAVTSFKVMLHRTIHNDDFKRNTALQCWNNVAAISTMLQLYVALKIVVVIRPVQHHLYGTHWGLFLPHLQGL